MSEPRTEHQDDPHPLASLECAELAVWMNGFTTTKPVFFENQVRVAFAALQARHAEEVAAKDKQIELDHRSKVELFRENATLRDQLAAVQQERETARAIARDALACWQGEDETQDGPGKRGRSAGSRATLRQRLAALSSPSTQEPNKETKMSSEPEIARCGLCGEPMPAGEEMFNYHGYSGPCPTPAPKPPQKATCETHGHIYGHEGVCLF